MKPIPGAQQRSALDMLLAALTPAELRLPASVRSSLPPRPPGFGRSRELFRGHTGVVFDLYAPSEVAAGMVAELIADPERAARLAYQKDFDARLPDLREVLETVSNRLWRSPVATDAYDASLQRLAQTAWMDALMDLAAHDGAAPAVRAATTAHLRELEGWLAKNPGGDWNTRAHRSLTQSDLTRFLARDWQPKKESAVTYVPPGEPIGQADEDWMGRQERRERRMRWLERYADFDRECEQGL